MIPETTEYEETPGERQELERLDKLGLINKEIEPDKATSNETVTRNLQLGNLSGKDYKDVRLLQDMQINFDSIPFNQGGFLTHDLAKTLFAKKIDTAVIVSNSRQGFLRKNMRTLNRNQTMTAGKNKSPFSGRGDE